MIRYRKDALSRLLHAIRIPAALLSLLTGGAVFQYAQGPLLSSTTAEFLGLTKAEIELVVKDICGRKGSSSSECLQVKAVAARSHAIPDKTPGAIREPSSWGVSLLYTKEETAEQLRTLIPKAAAALSYASEQTPLLKKSDLMLIYAPSDKTPPQQEQQPASPRSLTFDQVVAQSRQLPTFQERSAAMETICDQFSDRMVRAMPYKCQYTGLDSSSTSCSFVCESEEQPGRTFKVNYPEVSSPMPSCAQEFVERGLWLLPEEGRVRAQRAIIARGCK